MREEMVSELVNAFSSPTFEKDGSFELDKPVGSMSISPCGRDVVLASRQGLHIIDLDSPWAPPRHLPHHTPWEVADVQWSPFPSRDYWVVSTSNQKALVWNLAMSTSQASIEHILHAHTRAITDINFSAHHPDILATCAVDSFVHCWDLRHPARPALTFCDWYAGATQVKWNRLCPNIIASSHDKFLQIWDKRKGAYPLRTINAHNTKIYGVDWNRTHENLVATCSLDKTIKFWDYTRQTDEPENVIETPFPVWRARHTPFGWGVLAMPQRGDNDLHLYDRRLQENTQGLEGLALVEPVHRFEGHHHQVKEFLWRPRGTIEDGIDNREFQLVSWGADRILRLHRVDSKILGYVGYEKGKEAHKKFNLTRKNAPYKTFRENPSKLGRGDKQDMTSGPQTNARISFGMDSQSSRKDMVGMGAPYLSTGWEDGDFLTGKPGMHTRVATRVDIDPIAWMKGVRIGKREADLERSIASLSSPSFKVDRNWDNFESLGEEITFVADKFRNVEFTKIDVAKRVVHFSINGPWGVNGSSAYIDCQLSFPNNYPTDGTPSFGVEKTASVDAGVIADVKAGVKAISTGYLAHQRSSLEAIVRYLQGEQSVEEIIAWTSEEPEDSALIFTDDREGSSSDEEDDLGSFANNHINDNGLTVSGVLGSSNNNANVPVPKACGAWWAEDGRLVCFFPPKEDKAQSLVGSLGLESAVLLSRKKKQMFDGFGNFQARLQNQKTKLTSLAMTDSEDHNSDSDSDDSYTSSSHSSASSQGLSSSRQHFQPTYPFRGDQFHRSRAADESQKSNGSVSVSRSAVSTAKNVVSIYRLDEILPAKRSLAKRYSLSGQDVCKRNALVAAEEGFPELADVWSLLDLIIREEVPLNTITDKESNLVFRVLTGHPINTLQRKDSGIALSYDSRSREGTTKSFSSVKWGHHPVGTDYLIKTLFSYFEQLGDFQMLALMSCILSRYPFSSNDSSDDVGLRKNLIYNRELPTAANPKHPQIEILNLNTVNYQWYWPTYEVAVSMHNQATSPSPLTNTGKLRIDLSSVGSSLGASSSDPNTPFSTGQTPPSSYRPERTGLDNSYLTGHVMSTSPEFARLPQRSNSNLASSFAASFPRSFAFATSASSSPPISFPKKRNSPGESYTTNIPPNVTWGATSIFGRSWSTSEEPRSSLTSTTAQPDAMTSNAQQAKVRIRLKNQDRFSNEGYAAASLLDSIDEWRIAHYINAYAYQLLVWDFSMLRTEILQYSKPKAGMGAPDAVLMGANAATISLGRRTNHHPLAASETPTLYLEKSCEECGEFMELGWGRSAPRCPACRAKSYPLFCALCDMLVRGRVSPCTGCGHILHSACHMLLNSNAEPARQSSLCISGCDCRCRERLVVDVKWPMNYQARLSSAPSTIREKDEADYIHEADSYSLWEDVAYESLAKNLGVAHAKSLKSKSSQIWKGRETRGNSITK